MKKNNLLGRLRLTFATVLRYWCGHAATLEAMNRVYIKEWLDEEGRNSVEIRIVPCGSIYHVAQTFFFNDNYIRDVSWLAIYSWRSEGTLISIGTERNLFFDPLQKLLYLEEWPDMGAVTVEKYKQI